MADIVRQKARELARKHIEAGDALGWFEAVYAGAHGEASNIPWADLAPNPNMVDWLEAGAIRGQGLRALKIGCGLGDDAEELAGRGFVTTAFDISKTAISWCRRRFPGSPVAYRVCDLFDAPVEWRGAFDLVVESYTLQVLPPSLRPEAVRRIAAFTAPGGTLLVIARGRNPDDPPGAMPWPLVREELAAFENAGLKNLGLEDYFDNEDPPVRRFRAVYLRSLFQSNDEAGKNWLAKNICL